MMQLKDIFINYSTAGEQGCNEKNRMSDENTANFKIKVSTELIPSAMQTKGNADAIGQKVKEARNEFAIPGKLEALCLHEAAHHVYLKKIGIEPIVFGPSVVYENNQFRYFLGGVKIPGLQYMSYSPKIVIGLARSGIAGIIMVDYIAEKLGNDPANPLVADLLHGRNNVEENDYETFDERCRDACRLPHLVKYDPPRYWRKAKAFVTKDLRREEMQQQIKRQSITIMEDEFLDKVASDVSPK